MSAEINLLPLAASICLLAALFQAWLMTMVRYFNVVSIRKVFPNYRDLVRSHVDYLIMAALMFSIYTVLGHLKINLPSIIHWFIFVGALYNPFGFVIQAIKPDIVADGGVVAQIGVALGFLPLSVGLSWAAVEIIIVTVSSI